MGDAELNLLRRLIVDAAREELLPRFNAVSHSFKADGSLITEADLAMDARLHSELAHHWPEIGLLSEEMPAEEQEARLATGDAPWWCLDPLDGTNNFAAGLPAFAVSLALIEGGRPEIGLIYDPLRDECFSARAGQGAWLNELSLGPRCLHRPLAHAMALVDLKRLPRPLASRIAEHPPYGSQRNFGSCALEWVWMAAGRGHVCLHGGQKLWDYAAGTLILEEAGGFSCTLEGDPVFRGGLAPRLVVCALDPELFRSWCEWLEVRPAAPPG